MDLTTPRMKKKVKKTTGFKVIKPLDLSVRNCLPCILPSSRRRVREMVDVVGRLGNALRRTCPLAHVGSPTLEAGFGKTRAALA
ncbi:hypothetical protein TNCV_2748961 [Trichonephila clavipes]|nr:hypothetical protein TNCV_2748961 [Trichonephila clavipes]